MEYLKFTIIVLLGNMTAHFITRVIDRKHMK